MEGCEAGFREAAKAGRQACVDNEAIELLNQRDTKAVQARLKARGEQSKILPPFKASERLLFPGFRDVTAYAVRKDAPTCSRVSFHYVLVFSSSKRWRLYSADVQAAFYIGQIRTGDADEP